MTTAPERLASVIADIDKANADDPERTDVDGTTYPNAVLYAQRMSECLQRYYPGAPETLIIAARAQHICRWKIPRDTYPKGRAGYNAWRSACRRYHAELTAEILAKHGYSETDIAQVSKLIKKQNLKTDPDSQALENVVVIVFVAHYLPAFAKKHSEGELVEIIRKTARKIDETAIAALQDLTLQPEIAKLINLALSERD